jgi:hypothetical protein
VYNSIDFKLIKEWIIVYDVNVSSAKYEVKSMKNILYDHNSIENFPKRLPLFKKNKKIKEIFNTNQESSWGNNERNIALKTIPRDRTGWVYYLDDDNIMHSNIWPIFQTQRPSNIVFVGMFVLGNPVYNTECTMGHVDAGGQIFPTSIALSISWHPFNYNADGGYITSICKLYSEKIKRISITASYHNGQYEEIESVHKQSGFNVVNTTFENDLIKI